MIFDRPQHYDAARASVDCFLSQYWPHKELIVFNATSTPLHQWWPRRKNYTEFSLRRQRPPWMLNLCLDNSNGEWCAHWQPDFWYDPAYLSALMERRNRQNLVRLSHRQVFSLKNKNRVIAENDDSMCWSFYRHAPVDFSQPLSPQFAEVAVVESMAHLVCQYANEIV